MSFNKIAIRVENLSKCYEVYAQPRERLKQFVLPPMQQFLGLSPKTYFKEFWALSDVSFEVRPGETVGIIGRNGSGKSTLLQMICGIMTPTRGSVQIQGRVAALLELGFGFNPEFSGRENIYLNASILGLSNEEISARFDAIAEFADIGEFIEQPVKTYSSGMMVRLAFAVIAHVDADILIIDEALAVGDAIFTQKCMRFIREFQRHRVLLFVSHDLAAVQNICNRALWLNHGKLAQFGPASTVAEEYLQYTLKSIYDQQHNSSDSVALLPSDLSQLADARVVAQKNPNAHSHPSARAKGWTSGRAEVTAVALGVRGAGSSPVFEGGEPVELTITARALQTLTNPILGFLVKDRLGQDLFGENSQASGSNQIHMLDTGSTFMAKFTFTLPLLPNGHYVIAASIADGDRDAPTQHHWLHDAVVFQVVSTKRRYGLVGIAFEKVELQVL